MTQHRQLDWWNEATGRALYRLMEATMSPEDLQAVTETRPLAEGVRRVRVHARTIRNWFWVPGQRRSVPTSQRLSVVCEILGVTMDQLRSASADHVAKLVRHPHSAVTKEVRKSIDAGTTEAVQILAPPGFLKTAVLREVEALATRGRGGVCVYINAPEVANVTEFWNEVARRFQRRGIHLSSDADRYYALEEGVEGQECVLLIDGADRWLLESDISRADASNWLSRVEGIPCLTIIAGMIDVNELPLITGGPDSPHYARTIMAEWNDRWVEWASEVQAEFGIADGDAERLDECAQRHPGAYLTGAIAYRNGDDAEEVVRDYHLRMAERILRRMSRRFRSFVTGDKLSTLNARSREAAVLLRSGLVVRDKSKVKPAIREWREAWRSYPND